MGISCQRQRSYCQDPCCTKKNWNGWCVCLPWPGKSPQIHRTPVHKGLSNPSLTNTRAWRVNAHRCQIWDLRNKWGGCQRVEYSVETCQLADDQCRWQEVPFDKGCTVCARQHPLYHHSNTNHFGVIQIGTGFLGVPYWNLRPKVWEEPGR